MLSSATDIPTAVVSPETRMTGFLGSESSTIQTIPLPPIFIVFKYSSISAVEERLSPKYMPPIISPSDEASGM